MYMPQPFPWGMAMPPQLHQTPGFPYNMGAIPEVVPGIPRGGQSAMSAHQAASKPSQAQTSHQSMPVPIHPGMMGMMDPRMMMMMGHPGMMSPYGMHPAMMQSMMPQVTEGSASSSASEPGSPIAQVFAQSAPPAAARKQQNVRFSHEHAQSPRAPPRLAPSRDPKGSFRYPAPPGASGPSTAYTSPASSALPTPSAHSYPAQGGYFAFVPYQSGSAQLSPTGAHGSYPATPAAYNAKTDPFAMQAMAGSLRDEGQPDQAHQRSMVSDSRYGRSWYGGR